jgi:orotate phosphoribosyltransferase
LRPRKRAPQARCDVKEILVSDSRVEAILSDDHALLSGHFLLRSGRHSDKYLQCALVLQHPAHAEELARMLAAGMKGLKVDAVLGPATGGIIVAYELARALGARAIFAERENDAFTLRRGFELRPGESVVVAEDVITTGGAAQEVLALAKNAGARVPAVAALVNRSGTNPFDVPFHFLYALEAPAWEPAACPLCKAGKPVVKPGSREVKK